MEATILTDADLSDEVYGSYEGFKFVCPDCKKPSVMVNPDMSPRCTRCNKEFVIQSKVVTSYATRLLKVIEKDKDKDK